MSGALPISRLNAGGTSEFPAFSDIVIEKNGGQTLAAGTELLSVNGKGQLLSFRWKDGTATGTNVGFTFYIDEVPYSVDFTFAVKNANVIIPLRNNYAGIIGTVDSYEGYFSYPYMTQNSYTNGEGAGISNITTNGASSNCAFCLKANEKVTAASSSTSETHMIIQNSDVLKFKKSLRIVTDKALPMSTSDGLQIAVGIM